MAKRPHGGLVGAWVRRRTPGGGAGLAALGTVAIVAACTAVAALMRPHFDLSNLSMIYLLGVVIAAVAFGRGPAIAAAFLSVAAFDFLFVPPHFHFAVSQTQYLVTLGVMLVVAAVIGTMTAWLGEQSETARQRERHTAVLYRLGRDLSAGAGTRDILEAVVRRTTEALDSRVAAFALGEDGEPTVEAGDAFLLADPAEREAAWRAAANGQIAGLAPSESGVLHLPLEAGTRVLGVVSVRAGDAASLRDPERFHLLRALVSQTAIALERARLAGEAQRARDEAEAERTRSALLSSVSHDLRTPLAAITGAATGLGQGALSEAARRELADTIAEEAHRLNRLIGNLLDMTRLESGTVRARKEWHSLEEIVGAALGRLESQLGDRAVRLGLPDDLPLVPLDDVLFEQMVVNLVENAHKYAPPGAAIDVTAAVAGSELRFEVADTGAGLDPGEERRVFDKFHRGTNAAGRPGVGLGLAICKAIAEAHGGRIEASNRPGGGASFVARLPIEGDPPAVEREPADDASPARSAP